LLMQITLLHVVVGRSDRSRALFRRQRPEIGLAQLLPDRLEDAGGICTRMLSDSFDSRLAQNGVVRIPTEYVVRQEVEVLVDAEAAAPKDLVDGYAIRLVWI